MLVPRGPHGHFDFRSSSDRAATVLDGLRHGSTDQQPGPRATRDLATGAARAALLAGSTRHLRRGLWAHARVLVANGRAARAAPQRGAAHALLRGSLRCRALDV